MTASREHTDLQGARSVVPGTVPDVAGPGVAPLLVRGRVLHGDARGRLLGFPTANLDATGLRAADGVWAGTAVLPSGGPATAVISIGHRPTYYGRRGERLVEAHLLDFDGDLYGLELVLHLRVWFRRQRRFRSTEDLLEQITADATRARRWRVSADGAHTA